LVENILVYSQIAFVRQRITQHKRFVPNGTHPNFCFAKTSYMLGTLYEIGCMRGGMENIIIRKIKNEVTMR
jgi:hypothetical protein